MRRPLAAVAFIAVLLTTGCYATPAPPHQGFHPAAASSLMVGAAADLAPAFTEIAAQYEAKTGRAVRFTFAATGQLAQQIENGAPIDLFAAASRDYVDGLQQKGLIIPETVQGYAIGQLVLAVNKASGAKAAGLKDLLDPQIKRVAIANPQHAPYGLAAKQALTAAGLWEKLQPKLVYGENIRQTVQFVQTGNAEAGLLARSEANLPELAFTTVPATLYPPLVQTLAVVKGTKNAAGARAFAEYVTSQEGRAVLTKYGYNLPEEP